MKDAMVALVVVHQVVLNRAFVTNKKVQDAITQPLPIYS